MPAHCKSGARSSRRLTDLAADTGMWASLLLLPLHAGAEAAPELAHEAWLGLAAAGHHHAYDLAPTVAELQGWHTGAPQLLTPIKANQT